jgi:hypothetical protein
MTPEAKLIAIAEACGIEIYYMMHRTFGRKVPMNIPDYLNDLNACHGMVKCLPKDEVSRYHHELYAICGGLSGCIDATAAQRAEAFLKTIGKWEE